MNITKKDVLQTNQSGKKNESVLDQVANKITEQGDEFGDTIIEMMQLNDVDRVKLGIVAVGLAKAVATLKVIAADVGIDINKLYKSELLHFQKTFKKISKVLCS